MTRHQQHDHDDPDVRSGVAQRVVSVRVVSACLTCGRAAELVARPTGERAAAAGRSLVWQHLDRHRLSMGVGVVHRHRPRVLPVVVDDRGCRLLEDEGLGRAGATLATLLGITLAAGAFVGALVGAAWTVARLLS